MKSSPSIVVITEADLLRIVREVLKQFGQNNVPSRQAISNWRTDSASGFPKPGVPKGPKLRQHAYSVGEAISAVKWIVAKRAPDHATELNDADLRIRFSKCARPASRQMRQLELFSDEVALVEFLENPKQYIERVSASGRTLDVIHDGRVLVAVSRP